MTLLRLLVALAVFFCVLGSPTAAVIHVDTSGDDVEGDGSAGSPYKTIQHAVDMAVGPDDTIRVSSGTYDECIDTTGRIGISIIAEDGDPTHTKIRGDGFCTTLRLMAGGTVSGFTIQDGGRSGLYGRGNVTLINNIFKENTTADLGDGGGAKIQSATCGFGEGTITISENVFDTNIALKDGGGLSVAAGLDPVTEDMCANVTVLIENNTFIHNSCLNDGGGLDFRANSLTGLEVHATITGNVIQENTAGDDGAGAQFLSDGTGSDWVTVSGNTFHKNNSNDNAGGMYVLGYRTGDAHFFMRVEDNLVTENTALGDGGGIYADLDVRSLNIGQTYSMVVRGNTARRNTAFGTSFGGGGILARYECDLTVEANAALAEFIVADNVLTDNTAVLAGGGISATVETNVAPPPLECLEVFQPASATMDVVNNLIAGNTVNGGLEDGAGGGMASLVRACFASLSDVKLRNNTIVDNDTNAGAGGLALGFSSLEGGFGRQVVSHTIVSGNSGYGLGGEAVGASYILDIDHSNVYGNANGNYELWIGDRTGGSGNISQAPAFADPSHGDYHLTASSPEVDAGDRVPGILPVRDLDGDPRVVDADGDGYYIVDMGYDELFICTDLDHDGYGDPILTGDRCDEDNCPDDFNPGQADCDADLTGDVCDADTIDTDLDGVDDGCDDAPGDAEFCGDADADDCDDCASGFQDPRQDGQDSDYDGLCDVGDPDDDSDGVADGPDPDPLDPETCGDQEGDNCDDCSQTQPFDIFNDGTDSDGDGYCNIGDTADFDPNQCGVDHDSDDCDDCSEGLYDPANDGPDFDIDGICDFGDPDDDNDGVADDADPNDQDASVCGDTDDDSCDDCAVGVDGTGPLNDSDPANDGADFDGDGLCDAGDPDDDNDNVADEPDSDPFNAHVCSDVDGDDCEDCVSGVFDPANDGADFEGDGLCDFGDLDDDNDNVADGQDSDPFNPNVCGDIDGDDCEDCVSGVFDPANDGADFEGDGLCDSGDPDDDNDNVADDDDEAPFDGNACRDVDGDGCDDCSSGTDAPLNDGADFDLDGICDDGDPDDDNDGAPDLSDCAQFVNSVSEPAGALGATLRFGSTTTDLHWLRIAHANVYNVWRGSFSNGAGFSYDHSCLEAEVPALNTTVADVPAPGEGYYYLVAGSNVCGGGGSLGTDSAGLTRPEDGSCPTLNNDGDADGVSDINDGCPADANPTQTDSDVDGVGDVCDNCPVPNSNQWDLDLDGSGDACDTCTDPDEDGFGTPGFAANQCELDNCPDVFNPLQADDDLDGIGDLCDICPADPDDDLDLDGVCGDTDNCVTVANRDQLDFDADGAGDVCDSCTDGDDDGFGDIGFDENICPDDNCPTTDNPLQEDRDADGVGDLCDVCPDDFDPAQVDADGDLVGDLCDPCANNADLGCVACPVGTDPDQDGSCVLESGAVEFGSATTYLDNAADPELGLTWTAASFVPDGSWSAGIFGVGFEAGSGAQDLIQTTVLAGANSIYTRTTFDVVDPLAIQRIAIAADYDDGYVAWINGVEVYRSPEMPTGDPSWNAAPVQHESSNGAVPDYGRAIDVTGVASLQVGTNVLAVGVWNSHAASSDLVIVPQLTLSTSTDNCPDDPNPNQSDFDGDGLGDSCDVCPTVFDANQEDFDNDGLGDACDPCAGNPDIGCLECPPGTDADGDGVCQDEQPVVEQGGEMMYLANVDDPGIGISWTTNLFIPTTGWDTANYGVGYDRLGNADALINTVVPHNSVSIYTRAVFEIADTDEIDRVLLGADYDDGYIAWINGVEVYRSPEMPPTGDPDWDTFALEKHESSNGALPVYLPIVDVGDSDVLRNGTNLLAIGVWNDIRGSSDLVLVPRLVYTTMSDNCPDDPNPGQEDTDGDGIGDECDQKGFSGPSVNSTVPGDTELGSIN